jgi:type I restriction enzyme S subunit
MRKNIPLSDLCLLITDGSHYSPKEEMNGIPMFSVKDMGDYSFETTNAKRISEDEYQKLKRNGCEPEIDDVVIAKDGSVLKHVFRVSVKEKCVLLSSIAILRPNPEIVDGEFLAYSLKNPIVQSDVLANYVSGSGVPRIVLKDFKRIPLAVPDLKTQKSIASVLRNIDRKISINSQISNSLEQVAQRIFKSWFIDFDPVKAKMAGENPVGMDRATVALFPDSMEDSELGAIPKGWLVKPLFDFKLDIESGSRPKGGVKGISEGIPSIGAESINGIGVFDFLKTKYVSKEFYSKMNKGKPRDFDVLLYKDGGKPGVFKPRVGMYGLGFPFGQYAINEHVFLLRSAELGPAFTYFWIRMERTLDVLRNRGIKAAIPGINQQDVGTLPVLWSNSELVARFNEFCMPYLELILTLAAESLELSRLRDSLLPRLISGELQIPEEMLVS